MGIFTTYCDIVRAVSCPSRLQRQQRECAAMMKVCRVLATCWAAPVHGFRCVAAAEVALWRDTLAAKRLTPSRAQVVNGADLTAEWVSGGRPSRASVRVHFVRACVYVRSAVHTRVLFTCKLVRARVRMPSFAGMA